MRLTACMCCTFAHSAAMEKAGAVACHEELAECCVCAHGGISVATLSTPARVYRLTVCGRRAGAHAPDVPAVANTWFAWSVALLLASALDANTPPPSAAAAAEPALLATLGLALSPPPSLLTLDACDAAGVPPKTVPPKATLLNAPLPNVEVPPKAKPLAPLLARPPKPPVKGAAEAAGSADFDAPCDGCGVSFSDPAAFAFFAGTSTLSERCGCATCTALRA